MSGHIIRRVREQPDTRISEKPASGFLRSLAERECIEIRKYKNTKIWRYGNVGMREDLAFL